MAAALSVHSERRLTSGPAVDLRPNWDADGRSVVFERQEDGRSRLYRIAADGAAEPVALDACNEGAETVQGRPAFFGPDDFAFVSDRGGRLALWRHRAGAVVSITAPDGDGSYYGPAAFPGRPRLLFFRDRTGTGEVQLCETDPEGGAAVRALTDAPGSSDQPWPVPGSDAAVFHSDRDGADAVWRLDLATGEATRLTPQGEGEGTAYVTPFPSPDGERVAFGREVDGDLQVWAMLPDGTGRQPLVTGGASFPAWSPDGGHLVFVRGHPTAEDGASGDLWVASVALP